ncbi:hypothetical protein BJ912DRAFT_1065127 [Pholiota molesta]|nr:hypothetical protein BJ912DRAFT_1065127 [Pholiota molesta]
MPAWSPWSTTTAPRPRVCALTAGADGRGAAAQDDGGAQSPLAASRALLVRIRAADLRSSKTKGHAAVQNERRATRGQAGRRGRRGEQEWDLRIVAMRADVPYRWPRVVGSPLSFTSYIPVHSIQRSGDLLDPGKRRVWQWWGSVVIVVSSIVIGLANHIKQGRVQGLEGEKAVEVGAGAVA